MWPFGKKKGDEKSIAPSAEPEASRTDWQTLPAPPVAIRPLELTLDTQSFEPGLSTRRDPELFLAPLEHEVSEEGPSGLIEGVITVIERSEERRELPIPVVKPPLAPVKASETGGHELPSQPVDGGVSRSVPEIRVVSVPPPKPEMTKAPDMQTLLPRLDLRPPKPVVAPADPALDPGPPEPEKSPLPLESLKVDNTRPTLGRQESPPRRLGLGEPISKKPEKPAPAIEAKTATPVAPQAPELTLPPVPESRDVEIAQVVIPPEAEPQKQKGETTEPSKISPRVAEVQPPSPAVKESRLLPPLKPRFTPSRSKSEVRPTLAARSHTVQRQIAGSSPSLPRPQTPSPAMPPRKSAKPADLPDAVSDFRRPPVEAPARPKHPQPELIAPGVTPAKGGSAPFQPQATPVVPIRRVVPEQRPAEMPLTAVGLQAAPQKEVEMPLPKQPQTQPMPIYRPKAPSVPAMAHAAARQAPPPAAPPAEVKTPTPEPAVTVQRVASPAAPIAGETPRDKKDETDVEADAIYEKIRTRLRKEFRMYREQAGLSTYGG